MHFQRTLSTPRLLTLLRHLGVALGAGLPLPQALGLLERTEPKRGKPLLQYLRLSVEKGGTLASAMESAPVTFPPLAISLVRAGEVSGTLEENLRALVDHIHKGHELQQKIRAAMLYPCIVLGVVFLGGLGVGNFVLPQLLPLFTSLGVNLPITTRFILWMALFFRNYGIIATPAAILLGAIFLWILQKPMAKGPVDRVILSIPWIGLIQRGAAIQHITGALCTLLRSGVPLVDALPTTARATKNIHFSRAVEATIPLIQQGHTLSQALRTTSNLFPEMTVAFIEIGEQAGTLADTLAYIAESTSEELKYSVQALTVVIEPALLIVIGTIVAVFVLSIILPIYNVISVV